MLTVRFTVRCGGQVILVIGFRMSGVETIVFLFAWLRWFRSSGVRLGVSSGSLLNGVLRCGGFDE